MDYRLLPVQHCLVTFTVPDKLCSLLRACPKEGYDAIFEAGSATIRKLLGDPSVWHKWWEVNVKPMSDGRAVLKYLARQRRRTAAGSVCLEASTV